ncbi:MAG: penicillin-binding protein 2 [Burkholderiales bacterium]|nr:penicillin-binding protein 2 [Burkholderiales bacterium]
MANYKATANYSVKLQTWRAYSVLGALLALFLLLIGRAAYLQGYKEDFLIKEGEQRFTRKLTLEANRGMITDRNGKALAISTPVQSITAFPSDMDDLSASQTAALASALDLAPEDVKRKLEDKRRDFVFLRRQMSPEAAERVMSLDIPGISKQTEYRRYYPAGEETAHIIGFTDIDNHGQEGFELTRDAMLVGKPGSREVIKDRNGFIVEDIASIEAPRDGQTLTLSIDSDLQHLAYSELKQSVEINKAKGGGIVVLDARTGEVLALANMPSYNPNNREKLDPDARRNRALTDAYEPGSTMKPFTVAEAIEQNKITPNSMIDTGNGRYVVGGYTTTDAHPHGNISVQQVIKYSSNVGAAKIQMMMSRESIWNLYNELGFGTQPHTGFPGETSGRLRAWKNWVPVDQATMSHGNGISVSLLQIARAYQIFATDGQERPISFQRLVAPLPGKQVIKPETAKEIRDMLQMVTEPGGTAPQARVVGYRVGGKTGTAYKPENGGYNFSRYVGSFVGVAPMSDPRVIVAVMIDEPSAGKHFGGDVAAPVFSKVVAGCMRMMGIPPDAPQNTGAEDTNVPAEKEEM